MEKIIDQTVSRRGVAPGCREGNEWIRRLRGLLYHIAASDSIRGESDLRYVVPHRSRRDQLARVIAGAVPTAAFDPSIRPDRDGGRVVSAWFCSRQALFTDHGEEAVRTVITALSRIVADFGGVRFNVILHNTPHDVFNPCGEAAQVAIAYELWGLDLEG